MKLILAEPRGFCAGVRRAIEVVEKAILKYGVPIYVKHEIVHNQFIIQSFESKGVKFVEDVSSVPQGSVLIYSAHGVSNAIENEALNLKMVAIDATCPLVQKVHRAVIKYEQDDFQILLIGHKNHPEMEGTKGRLKNPEKAIIIETIEDAKNVIVKNPEKLVIATQTTLSLDDTAEITNELLKRFPNLSLKNDICYATQNRQDAVKQMIKQNIEGLIVLGSKNSSNSNRLRDLGEKHNISSFLINNHLELDFEKIKHLKTIGITAGASAPEVLVQGVINFLKEKFVNLEIEILNGVKEETFFFLPKELR